MSIEPLNTAPIQQFLQQVKAADAGKQKEIRIDIVAAKNLAFTLGIVMSRLEGDLEKLISENKPKSGDDVITIKMDSGNSW